MAKKPTLGELMAVYIELKETCTERSKEIKELEETRNHAEAELIAAMQEQGLNRVSNDDKSFSIAKDTYFSVEDWDAFERFMKEENAVYLLQRRTAVKACREMLEERGDVPGLKPFEKSSLSVRSL